MSNMTTPKAGGALVEAAPALSSGTGHIQAGVIGILLLVAFWPILVSMYGSWFDDKTYMEHGVLVIPAAAYMAWTKRSKLAQIPRKPSIWGVFFLFWGAVQATLGMAAHWAWVSRMAFLVSLVGSILALYGARVVWELMYPLCTLLL